MQIVHTYQNCDFNCLLRSVVFTLFVKILLNLFLMSSIFPFNCLFNGFFCSIVLTFIILVIVLWLLFYLKSSLNKSSSLMSFVFQFVLFFRFDFQLTHTFNISINEYYCSFESILLTSKWKNHNIFWRHWRSKKKIFRKLKSFLMQKESLRWFQFKYP